MGYCINCGKKLDDNMRFCTECGAVQTPDSSSQKEASVSEQAAPAFVSGAGEVIKPQPISQAPTQAVTPTPAQASAPAQAQKAPEASAPVAGAAANTYAGGSDSRTAFAPSPAHVEASRAGAAQPNMGAAQQRTQSSAPDRSAQAYSGAQTYSAAHSQQPAQYNQAQSNVNPYSYGQNNNQGYSQAQQPYSQGAQQSYNQGSYQQASAYNPFLADQQPPANSTSAPVGTGAYIGLLILFTIPVVGFIAMIAIACGVVKNENIRNLAKAYLIMTIIVAILAGIFVAVMTFFIYRTVDSVTTSSDWSSIINDFEHYTSSVRAFLMM